MSIFGDYMQGTIFELNNIDSNSSFAVYASSATDPKGAIYGSDRFTGDLVTKQLKIPVEGVANNFQVEVEEKQSVDDRSQFELLAISLEVSGMGR